LTSVKDDKSARTNTAPPSPAAALIFFTASAPRRPSRPMIVTA
jgi:hypothetical protein